MELLPKLRKPQFVHWSSGSNNTDLTVSLKIKGGNTLQHLTWRLAQLGIQFPGRMPSLLKNLP